MKITAVANSKGGTGKTTVAVHLAEGLARAGARVLLVDSDPQANATSWLMGSRVGGSGAADAMLDRVGDGTIREVPRRARLSLLPATLDLGGAGAAVYREAGGHTLLARALKRLAKQYDHVVIDTRPGPPAGDPLLISVLYAAHAVIVPVLPGVFALEGLATIRADLEKMAERLPVSPELLGAVLFAADQRQGLPAECRALLQSELKGRLFRAEIRVSIVAATLPGRQRTAWDEYADRRGAVDYPLFVREVQARLGRLKGAR